MRNPTPYNEALKIVERYKAVNTCSSFYDKGFRKSVRINHEDGTSVFYNDAFSVRWKDWYIVCTEHHGYFAYHMDDAQVYQYSEKLIQSTDLGDKDTCEKCEKEFSISVLCYGKTTDEKGRCGIEVLCLKCKGLIDG